MSIPGSELCPVAAFRDMVKVIPAPRDAPAFCYQKKGRLVPMTYTVYQKSIKKLVAKMGLNPKRYSTHSFSRGGATYTFNLGPPGEVI